MKVKELISTLENGATKLTIYEPSTGEIHFQGIWLNTVPADTLEKEVIHIKIDRYEMKLEVK